MSWAIEERDYSQRRACALVGLAPKVYRYRRGSEDGVLRTRLRALAAHRRRFGYRRLHLLLRREGFGDEWRRGYGRVPDIKICGTYLRSLQNQSLSCTVIPYLVETEKHLVGWICTSVGGSPKSLPANRHT